MTELNERLAKAVGFEWTAEELKVLGEITTEEWDSIFWSFIVAPGYSFHQHLSELISLSGLTVEEMKSLQDRY